MQEFNKKFREIRKKLNLSQAQAALLLNVDTRTVSAWERAEKGYAVEKLVDKIELLELRFQKLKFI